MSPDTTRYLDAQVPGHFVGRDISTVIAAQPVAARSHGAIPARVSPENKLSAVRCTRILVTSRQGSCCSVNAVTDLWCHESGGSLGSAGQASGV